MKTIKIEIKWAVLFSIMVLFWMLLERIIGLHSEYISKHAIYTNLIIIPSAVIYILALRDKRTNHYKGIMTYKQSFMSGMILTVLVLILSPLTQYLTSTFITPEYFPNVIAYVVDNDLMKLEDAENYFNLKMYIIQGLIGTLILGLIITTIVSIFLKRTKTKVNG